MYRPQTPLFSRASVDVFHPQQQARNVGDCQNDGPFLGPYYNTGPNTGPNSGDPKRDHHFDNPPCTTFFVGN